MARDIDDELTVTDALASLQSTGLVHRHAGFVFATRAAQCATQLVR